MLATAPLPPHPFPPPQSPLDPIMQGPCSTGSAGDRGAGCGAANYAGVTKGCRGGEGGARDAGSLYGTRINPRIFSIRS